MSEKSIDNITHDNILKIFNLPKDLIPNTRRAGKQSEKELEKLAKEYEFDAFSALKQ